MNHYVKRRLKTGYFILLALAVFVMTQAPWLEPAAPAFARMTQQTLVIDPGHGGEDGGAVSVTGQPESQINLAIALNLEQLMGFYGVPTVMTRRQDVSIHDEGADTLRKKKVSDLHNRVALINAVENATLISIHQNASPSPKHQGIQVFYGDEVLSRPLAQAIQKTMTQVMEPGKARVPQRIPTSVYLMNHVSCRAVLVECGFVSNPEEEKLLLEPAYQRKLAMTLAACYITSGSSTEGENLV